MSDLPVCRRVRCKRTKDVGPNGLCGGHACPVPGCDESKSSTIRVCEVHEAMKGLKAPKGWGKVSYHGYAIFVNIKEQFAQYTYPGDKGEHALDRPGDSPKQKPKKGTAVIYVIAPQPPNMPDGWEQVLGVGKDAKPVVFFRNLAEKILQKADPRPDPNAVEEDDENALPEGWSEEFDADGDKYFIDHNTGMCTYDDPRLVPNPVPSAALTPSNRRASHVSIASHGNIVSQKKAKGKDWHLGPRDVEAYSDLEDNLTTKAEIPECVRNKRHNRYMDILPNPRTAVRLAKIGDDEESEYVNANFVHGCNGNEKEYIAAMGPKPTTTFAFWRALWENKVEIIIMTTGLLEKGKKKCERYWPAQDDGTAELVFGDIHIFNTSSVQHNGYIQSVLKVKRDNETRTIHHFWYNTWPDHGVPKDEEGNLFVDDMLDMLRMMNLLKRKIKSTQPVLVHCSAGIGRTGCFIATEHCLKILEEKHSVDVIEVIKDIRNDRCAMVQHPQQFELVHEACIRFAELTKHKIVVEGAEEDKEEEEESAEAKAERRSKEKKDAEARARETKEKTSNFKRVKTTRSQMNGELRLGSVEWKGEYYVFHDPDGSGAMDRKEAEEVGYPEELFLAMDTNKDDIVSPREFKAFQRKQRREKLAAQQAIKE